MMAGELTFADALDRLGALEGQNVTVYVDSSDKTPHPTVMIAGKLSAVEMSGAGDPADGHSVAQYRIGSGAAIALDPTIYRGGEDGFRLTLVSGDARIEIERGIVAPFWDWPEWKEGN